MALRMRRKRASPDPSEEMRSDLASPRFPLLGPVAGAFRGREIVVGFMDVARLSYSHAKQMARVSFYERHFAINGCILE